MSNNLEDRISRIQGAHPWMLEREPRHLLVGAYAALTEGLGCTGRELHERMEVFTEYVCRDLRCNVEQLLIDTEGMSLVQTKSTF